MTDAERPWPATQIERRRADQLIPSPRNARTHSDAQVRQIAAAIKEWGWTTPILVDEQDGVIAGHGRLAAAKLLAASEVPVIVARGWTDTQKRAYMLADNKLALNSGWDNALLGAELADLRAGGADLASLGFAPAELNDILTPRGDDADVADAESEPPLSQVSRAGDVWVLDAHRLACGDCTDPATVAAALAGATPNLMVTDPPYGVEYDATWRAEPKFQASPKRRSGRRASAKFVATGAVDNDHRADWRDAWALFAGDIAYVWHGGVHGGTVQASLAASGFTVRAQIIWNKALFALSRGDYHWQHEPCWYAVRNGKTGRWTGDRKQTTVWTIASGVGFTSRTEGENARTCHSTQKPVECMRRPIINHTLPGDVVYEPFSGSGTTIIAAETTGRGCRAIEVNGAYVDAAVRRWQTLTGRAAILEASGQSFAEAEAARA